MQIDQEMCSANCPCKKNTAKKGEWEKLDKNLVKRCKDFDFTGDYETYDQCLSAAASVPVADTNTKFQKFARELE